MGNRLTYKPAYRRRLPHIQPPGATLFITTRLTGSVPAHVVAALQEQLTAALAQCERVEPEEERLRQSQRLRKQMFGRFDAVLDEATHGPTWLARPEIAALVSRAIHYRDGRQYNLHCFTMMPNHIHLLVTPRLKSDDTYCSLSAISHSLKRYTAREANKLLGRQGEFCQAESYDHYVRNEAEHGRIVLYILDNPVKAGLCDSWEQWPWNYLAPHPS